VRVSVAKCFYCHAVVAETRARCHRCGTRLRPAIGLTAGATLVALFILTTIVALKLTS
jgi:uncharacterized paraquat-inducible protein A